MSDLPQSASASNCKSRRSSILKKSPSRKLLEIDTNVEEPFSLVEDEGRRGYKRRVSFAHTYQVKEISRVADIAEKWPSTTFNIDTTNLDIPKLALSRKNSNEVGADGLNTLLSAPIAQSPNEKENLSTHDNSFNSSPSVDTLSLRHTEPIKSVTSTQAEVMRSIFDQPVVVPPFLANLHESKQLTSVENHQLATTKETELTCIQIKPTFSTQNEHVEDMEFTCTHDSQKVYAEDMELTCTLHKTLEGAKNMHEKFIQDKPLTSREGSKMACTQNESSACIGDIQMTCDKDEQLMSTENKQLMGSEDMQITCTRSELFKRDENMQFTYPPDPKMAFTPSRQSVGSDDMQMTCTKKEELFASNEDMQLTCTQNNQLPHNEDKKVTCFQDKKLPSIQSRQMIGSDDMQMTCTQKELFADDQNMQLTCNQSSQLPHNEGKQVTFCEDKKLASTQLMGSEGMQMTCTQKELFAGDQDMQLTCTQSSQLSHHEDKNVSTTQSRQLMGSDDMQMTCTQKRLFTHDENLQLTRTQSSQLPANGSNEVRCSEDKKLASTQSRQVMSSEGMQLTCTQSSQLSHHEDKNVSTTQSRQLMGSDYMQMTCTQKKLFAHDENLQLTRTQSSQLPANGSNEVRCSEDKKLASTQSRQVMSSEGMQMTCTQKELFTGDDIMQLTCTQSNQLPHNEGKEGTYFEDKKLTSTQSRQLMDSDDMQMTCTQKELFASDQDMQLTCTQSSQSSHDGGKSVASTHSRQLVVSEDMQKTSAQKEPFTGDDVMQLTCIQSNQLSHNEGKEGTCFEDKKLTSTQSRQLMGSDDMQMTCTQKGLFKRDENVQLTRTQSSQLPHNGNKQVTCSEDKKLTFTQHRQPMGFKDIQTICAQKELFTHVDGKGLACTEEVQSPCSQAKPFSCVEGLQSICVEEAHLTGNEELIGMQEEHLICSQDNQATHALSFGLECCTESSRPSKLDKKNDMEITCPKNEAAKCDRHVIDNGHKTSLDDATDVPLVSSQTLTDDVDCVFKDNERPDYDSTVCLCDSIKDEDDLTKNITMEEFVRDYMNIRIRANQKVMLRSRRSLIAPDSAKPESLPELINVYVESCYAPAYEQFIDQIQDKLNSIQADTVKSENAISSSNPEVMKLIRFGPSHESEELIKEVDELAINCKKLAKVYWKLAKSRLNKMLTLCGNQCVVGELLPALERFQEYGDTLRLFENSASQLQSALQKVDKEGKEIEEAGAAPSDEQVASYQHYVEEIQQLGHALKAMNAEEGNRRRCNDEYKQLMQHFVENHQKSNRKRDSAQTKSAETVKNAKDSKILKRYVLWDSVSDEPLCKRYFFLRGTLVFVFNLSKENMVLSTSMESCIADDISPSDIGMYKFVHNLLELQLNSKKLKTLQRFDEALNLVCCSIAEAQRLCLEISKLSLDFAHCKLKIEDTYIVVHFYSSMPCPCSVKIRFDFYDESNALCDFIPIHWRVVTDEPIFGVSATDVEKSLKQKNGQARLTDFASYVKKLMANGKPV